MTHAVVKVDRRMRWHYTTTIAYFAFALVLDSRGIEIVNFTISLALSAGKLMASAGTAYRLVPAHFYPWTHVTCRLAAKTRDQLRNPTLGNRVWATFTFFHL